MQPSRFGASRRDGLARGPIINFRRKCGWTLRPRLANSVGFTSNPGHSDDEFPLQTAQRAHDNKLSTAAFDPKRKSGYLDQFRLPN